MTEQTSLIIGLTGGAGSGKSSVAAYLGMRSSLAVIDADAVCRSLMAPGGAGWFAFRDSFGDSFFHADGSLDRKMLREAIFQNDMQREKVNDIMHPLARREIRRIIDEGVGTGQAGFLVEVPLLYEASWETDFGAVVVVYAPRHVCLKRLMLRDNISSKQAEAMLNAQMSLERKALRADHVIDNGGRWMDTCLQMNHLAEIF